ncbi:3-carboxy-cis,cis-muconate cycloisomerase, partial [Streptomyces sp. NPDC056362]
MTRARSGAAGAPGAPARAGSASRFAVALRAALDELGSPPGRNAGPVPDEPGSARGGTAGPVPAVAVAAPG